MKKLINLFAIILLFIACSSDDDNDGNAENGNLTLTVTVNETSEQNAVISWTLEGNTSPVVYEIVLSGQTVREGYTGSMYNLNGLEETTTYNGVVFAIEQNGNQTFANFEFTTSLDLTHAGHYVVDTQEKADNFYFTSISLDLLITNVTDISNLASLESVRNLYISDSNLENLNGLENLTNLNEGPRKIVITNNQNLEDVSALQGIRDQIDWLEIKDNPNLANLDGLGLSENADRLYVENMAIENFDGILSPANVWSIWLLDLPNLTSFEGLNNIETIGWFRLEDTPNISSFQGLNSLQALNDDLYVDFPISSLDGLDNLQSAKSLIFDNLETLTSLNGAPNLSTIDGDLRIVDCASFADIGNLDNLQTVVGWLEFKNLPLVNELSFPSLNFTRKLNLEDLAISNLDGFSNLIEINGGGFPETFQLIDLPNLNSISGISNLQTNTGRFELNNLPLLTSLEGFNLVSSGGLELLYLPNVSDFSPLNSLQYTTWINLGSLDQLENMDDLSNLVDSVNEKSIYFYVGGNTNLTDFCGLTNYMQNTVVSDLSGGFPEYSVFGNGYDPEEWQIESSTDCSL
ncbi:MAG: hypothetical protein Aureis2KO_22100 [Aureisphaera sp.]